MLSYYYKIMVNNKSNSNYFEDTRAQYKLILCKLKFINNFNKIEINELFCFKYGILYF